MSNRKLFLIDATAFCYRAFYALPRLTTSLGQPSGAVYGFINMLNKILQEHSPDYLVVCFDVSRDTVRLKKFAEYKIQRPPMPDDLSSQIPLIKEFISAYGICMSQKTGFEADDIVATLARQAKDKGISVTIVSSDKDILQLVDDNTLVFSPYKDEGVIYDAEKVSERFGVDPGQIADIIALMGDDADNIPGVAGIGEKTAVNLIKNFGSLDNLLKNIDKIDKEKLRDSVRENIEKIKLNKELAVLDTRLDIDFDLGKSKIGEPDLKELFRLFKYLEFKNFLKGLPSQGETGQQVQAGICGGDELEKIIHSDAELFLYGQAPDDMVFCAEDKFFRLDKAEAANPQEILSNPAVKKISHDLKAMVLSLAKYGVALKGLYFDTMVCAYLLNPSKPGYSLTDVAWDYLGQAINRNIDDLSALSLIRQLRPKLAEELRAKSLWNLFADLEMPLVEVLADMQKCGIKLDLEVLKGLAQSIEKRLIELIEDIYRISGVQFNINSPKQLRDVLFERLKLPVVKRTKTGPSTDEEVLRSLAGQHKLPALLLEYRQLMKLKTTYIDTLPDLVDPKTGRVHTSFNQTATETGRLSSSNPNLQNIPIKTDIGRKIRQAIIASSTDNYLLSCDYSQIELRILAHLSGDENLISAFRSNLDIHRATASLIYGLDESGIDEPMREVAKRINFGIIYGLSAYGLSRDLGITLDEAQEFIDAYFLRYPKVKEYIQKQIEIARQEGFVVTLLGRRRYTPQINDKNQSIRQFSERQAVNTPIQGSASDLIKSAMVEIYRQINARGLKAKMILQIHDELVFDVPDQELNELVEMVRDRMENVLKLDVPVRVDIKKGRNWLEMTEVAG